MFATDFLFDKQHASDLGLMICSFNDDFENATASGGEMEYIVAQTPYRNNFTFYGAQLNSVLVWNFSICKDPCKNDDNLYFNQYEESMIAKWLIKTDGYRWFMFDQEEYEDIFYKVYINMTPHQLMGRTIGFDLTVTSNCGYGFSDIIVREAIINKDTPLKINVHSDINTYILPLVKIYNATGNFYISNDNDKLQNKEVDKATEFSNISEEIRMDSDSDTITGLLNPNDFNWYFLRLLDGMNIITTDLEPDTKIKLWYREPRRVIV